ncbi:Rieske (2Fe-2S) protein [Marinomonas sp. GJ51-6]|uniref:aromatic ring-hydroxylating oxygenase subunit alpha n=1 Tax=Marinomonas sp. GJ51-6 TaxID=2992802 RepID=UPI0029343596|nr:Rieske (2Fe-2S) protein [Marinomonas sp. GJ51-6]WOD07622.1 Rieske (2Fe-2S) protein [Marinomonas sp. GJ51-6]
MHQKTLKHLALRKSGYTLDHELYCSSETFQDDLEEVFFKEWLFVTPACELPKKGDYVTYNIANYRMIIVRGNDDEVRAFHNSCRHRGSMICREAKGFAAKLVCPYHNWTYDFDGSLVWAVIWGMTLIQKIMDLSKFIARIYQVLFISVWPIKHRI